MRLFGRNRTYRKKDVYYIRARVPREGFPIDIQLWPADSVDIGYRYEGLLPEELDLILACESIEALGRLMFQFAHKAYNVRNDERH